MTLAAGSNDNAVISASPLSRSKSKVKTTVPASVIRPATAPPKSRLSSTPVVARSGDNEAQLLLDQLKLIAEAISTAVMIVDRNFLITYANRAAMAMIGKYRTEFGTVSSNSDSRDFLVNCIDSAHTEPELLKRMMAAPENLPYSTEISVGSARFVLRVSASRDVHERYNGNLIEWFDITERFGQEQTKPRPQLPNSCNEQGAGRRRV